MARITYDFVGSTNLSKNNPNLEGSAISRNMFAAFNGDEKDKRYYMESAPGVRYWISLGDAGQVDGMYVPSTGTPANNFEPDLFVAYGGEVYKVARNGEATVIGSYAAGNCVQFNESGGERAILLWVDGQNIYGWDIKKEKVVNITLPKRITENASIKPSHIAVVSGTIVINDLGSGYVYYSVPYPLSQETRNVFDIENGEVQYESDGITVKMRSVDSGEYCFLDNYGVQKYFNAESSSDKINAIYSVGSLLTLFGPSSIEFWQKADSDTITWARVSYSVNKEQGLEARYSLASVNRSVFCIGTGKSQAKCVLMINDTNVQKISPEWMDKLLNASDVKNVRGWTYSKNNHSFYMIAIGDETYCYDVVTAQWHIRSSRNFYTSQNKKYMPQFAVWFNNKIITGSCENGNLYELDEDYYREDFDSEHSLPLYRVRQTPVMTSNYKNFLIHELALECNAGHVTTYGKPARALLQVSRDGGYRWSNVIEGNVGVRGQFGQRLRWLNLGMMRQGVLRVMFSEDSDFVISDASIRLTECQGGI